MSSQMLNLHHLTGSEEEYNQSVEDSEVDESDSEEE